MSANRAARRRAARGDTATASPECPVRVSQVPATEAERRELQKRCLRTAKANGFTGKRAQLLATQWYNAAVAEASRAVREPATQPSVLSRPGPAVPIPPTPRGMQQTRSGLYVPVSS